MRNSASSLLLLAVAVLCVLGAAHASKHVWEVQSKTCMVRKDCPTVVMKGNMGGPKAGRKWEFGKFAVREIFPHYTRASKDSHWKITLVDRESAKGNVRRLLLPGGSHSKAPIKMCCSFFDHRNPTIRCKVNDYLQNINPNDNIKLLFGPRRPQEEQLWQRLPKRGPVDFEIQDRRRRCKVRKGAQFVIIHSGKSLPADNGVGLSAHFQAKKATIHTLNVEDKWFATLGRIDSSDREEEPERLCCSFNNGGKDNENTELKCLSKSFFKRITKGSAIQVWTASARRPRRNKLAHQMKCQGFPQPTPQGWSPLAFPDPIPEDVAEKAAKDATSAMKSLETMVRK